VAAKHADTLRGQTGEPVVLVLPALPAYIRNRMVRCGLPFIVPGSQIFLPTARIDLRERFRQPKPKAGNIRPHSLRGFGRGIDSRLSNRKQRIQALSIRFPVSFWYPISPQNGNFQQIRESLLTCQPIRQITNYQ
jgi:hypothetical protein